MASVPSTPTVATVLGIYHASLNSKYCDYLCKPSFALNKRGAQKAEGVIVLSFAFFRLLLILWRWMNCLARGFAFTPFTVLVVPLKFTHHIPTTTNPTVLTAKLLG